MADPDREPVIAAPEGSEPPSSGVPRRDWLLGGVVVVVLLALLGATAAWRAVRTDDVALPPATTAAPPTTEAQGAPSWPIEIQPLAEFVEQHRGGPFDHPVPIEYLQEDDYKKAITAATASQTDEDRAATASGAAQLTALGLLAPGVDLDKAIDQLQGEGTLAYYDEDTNDIKVLGSNFDVSHRVTLVHELTHAWQDQHGYLDKLDDLDDTEATTLRATAEGDATRIENEYIDSLSSREQNQYDDQSMQQAAQADLSGVPDALVAFLQYPYALGTPFVSILDATGGNPEVDKALAVPPPAEADLFEPSRYLDGVQPVDVPEPAVPDGAEHLDDGTFGASSWLFTLSERIDPRDALDLVDRWAGDSFVSYRVEGRACNAAAYRGRQPGDATIAAQRMSTWAAASPTLDATVGVIGDDVVLRSCEPAAGTTGATPVGRSQLALSYAALRSQAEAEVVGAGKTTEEAACFGGYIVAHLTPEQMQSGAANDPDTAQQLGTDAAGACF